MTKRCLFTELAGQHREPGLHLAGRDVSHVLSVVLHKLCDGLTHRKPLGFPVSAVARIPLAPRCHPFPLGQALAGDALLRGQEQKLREPSVGQLVDADVLAPAVLDLFGHRALERMLVL